MKGNDAVVAVIESLEKLGIDYMITGSYASYVHGVPRSTKDADFIVEAPPDQVSGHSLDWPCIEKCCAEPDATAALEEARSIAEG